MDYYYYRIRHSNFIADLSFSIRRYKRGVVAGIYLADVSQEMTIVIFINIMKNDDKRPKIDSKYCWLLFYR